MSSSRKRIDNEFGITPKKMKKQCMYGENCYRKNPSHLTEYYHPHLDVILASYSGSGQYPIPDHLKLYSDMIREQLDIIRATGVDVKKSPSAATGGCKVLTSTTSIALTTTTAITTISTSKTTTSKTAPKADETKYVLPKQVEKEIPKMKARDPRYRPMVIPTRRPEEFLKVVPVKGRMLKKHEQSAPFHIFYTTISSAPQTHHQPLSITFQEILDLSLGELRSSLQINFVVEPGWLLAQYYFAGYSAKRLTILYGDKNDEMDALRGKKPNVDAHLVQMVGAFGIHHTKLMILDYEDGSLRVVISTANLYFDDWENRTQGLWMSPNCPPLPEGSSPSAGESPTKFKSYLIKYLKAYCRSEVNYYIERVEACNFTHINVFLIGSVPGSHYDSSWGMKRVGMLLREHCTVPAEENHEWQLIGQASSVGSFGKDPSLWLTGAFQQNFCATKNNSNSLQRRDPEFNFIYPSLDNVKQSHDELLGGGCLPYSDNLHSKQGWITKYMCEWSARISHRHRAMPHLKSYLRYHSDGKAAYYILTSGNLSKAAWGIPLKNKSAIRILNYELGVLLLPKFITGKDYFTTKKDENDALYLPYDIPLVKYASNTRPWLMDYITKY